MIRSLWALPRAQLPTSFRERLRSATGALVGIALTGLVSSMWAKADDDLPVLMAPIGASAVLLFAVPASPLAQPWAIIAGNFFSALIGVTAARTLSDQLTAAAVAVALAVMTMFLLRCIHPPSGAVALTAVIGGPHIWDAGYSFVVVPVLFNSVLITIAAVLFNNLTGTTYPHHSHPSAHPHPPQQAPALSEADFDAVLADYGEALDISRDDLQALYSELRGREERRSALAQPSSRP